jgi:membrane-associated phospholipid phosphatase
VNVIARIISLVFHPLLLSTYLFCLFAFTLPVAFDPIREDNIWRFIALLFGVTFVFPALNISLLKAFGTIRTYQMVGRRERIIPFVFISALYCGVTYLFFSRQQVSFSDNFVKFLIIIDALVLVSTIATFFYKVSVHSLGAWGLIGILLPLNRLTDSGELFYPLLATIVVAGVIMSARLKLNVHTPREVMIGSLLGFATSFIGMRLLFY